MNEQKKLGINDTKEAIIYAKAVVDSLLKAKSDDGKISKADVLSTLTVTLPEAISAVAGSWNIPAEVKDLDADEKNELLALMLPVVLDIAKFFSGDAS